MPDNLQHHLSNDAQSLFDVDESSLQFEALFTVMVFLQQFLYRQLADEFFQLGLKASIVGRRFKIELAVFRK